MTKVCALIAGSLFLCASAAFADTTVEHSSVSGGGMSHSSTMIEHNTNPPVITTPTPASVRTTKFKNVHYGINGKTKIKGESTTVTP
jgi:hypothetical protein